MSKELERTRHPAGFAHGELDLLTASAKARNVALWHVLTVERRLPEDVVATALSESLGFSRVRLDAARVQPEALKLLPPPVARKYVCLPLELTDRKLVLAMANPQDIHAIDAVQSVTDHRVHPVVATRREILKGIDRHYAQDSTAPRVFADTDLALAGDDAIDLDRDEESQPAEAAAIVAMCHQILFAAVKTGASDVHIEPDPTGVRVRLRVDGLLRDYLDLPVWMQRQLLSRIKVLARLDIAQQRLPQDGRIKARSRDGAIDVRVSTLPTQYGEKIVLRMLGSSAAPSLLDLGLSDTQLAIVDEALHQPQGLVLVTGPTGSGKSTTLYSMLTRRQAPDVNVVTVEDPIERRLPGITQSQVNDKAGTTFATYLRAILRQDPDVIMIGEVRDLESAEIAFQAALTGHLVLTTLHTNGTLEALDRLLDIGVKPLMITSVTNVVVAQRLARLICPHCRVQYQPSPAAAEKLGLDPHGEFTRGRGCASCSHTGYRGRVGIFELLRLTPRLKELIRGGAGEAELRAAATTDGVRWLSDDAANKIRQGLTTIEEVLRVVRIDGAGVSLRAIVHRRG